MAECAAKSDGMYQVDDKDRVRDLTDIPQSSVGAPVPAVIAGEHSLAVVFYAETHDPDWDGATARVVDADSSEEPTVIVRFEACYAHMFGPPNDEAFSGHPLYHRGLRPYGNFEVESSSWLRALEKMNSVHPYHHKKRFMQGKRHFVLAFHDSTFECIAEGYRVETARGSMREVSSRLAAELE